MSVRKQCVVFHVMPSYALLSQRWKFPAIPSQRRISAVEKSMNINGNRITLSFCFFDVTLIAKSSHQTHTHAHIHENAHIFAFVCACLPAFAFAFHLNWLCKFVSEHPFVSKVRVDVIKKSSMINFVYFIKFHFLQLI